MPSSLKTLIKNASPKELVKIYFTIESKVLPFLEEESEKAALDDLEKGRVRSASSAKGVIKKCLE
ncbi:hypothetical protein K9L63_00635 [Candidatus Gracilibacteria bacterium]|nr:hypothetical protein [Candidatus Gracilibacteria bacterium]